MVNRVKGTREPHEVKKKSFDFSGNRTHDLRIRYTVTLRTELRGRTEKVGEDFFFTSCGSLIPFTRANAQWVIHGLN